MKKYISNIHFTFVIILAGMIILFAACADVKITHSWKTNDYLNPKLNKILIVGLFTNKDRGLREKMETHLQGDLASLGYNAVSSMQLYGPLSFEDTNEDTLLSKINNDGVDAVLTIVLLDRKKEKKYIPGSVYYSPFFSFQRRFWPYYGMMYERIYSPGYYQTSTKYFWESNLYDLKSKQLIYSVQTESFDPNEATTLAHRYGKVIINDLKQKSVLR